MAIMQLAKPGADVALDPAIFQEMPVAAQFAMNRLIYVATDLFLGSSTIGGQVISGQNVSDSENMVVRPSAVAGQFYPGDADRLRKQVSDLLANVSMPIKNIPKALIVPHAGYVYSGALLRSICNATQWCADNTCVVLIGPAHYVMCAA